MDKKLKTSKYSLKNLHSTTDKFKNTRTSTARNLKNLDFPIDQKPVYINRIKSHNAKTHREMIRSAMPLDINLPENQTDSKMKHFQSNLSLNQLFQSQSEKTIKVKTNEKQKCRNKSSKKTKINKSKKYSKCEIGIKSETKGRMDSRKCSISSSNLQSILKRTQALLKIYEKRQNEWQKERTKLVEQLQQLKHKNQAKGLATTSSIYVHRYDYLY